MAFSRLRSCGLVILRRNAAAARRVRHQHGVASGQRQIGRERRALVAALFLDDLDQDDLAALDDFLDLVAARAPAAGLRHLSEFADWAFLNAARSVVTVARILRG